jgi:hypothetical protein
VNYRLGPPRVMRMFADLDLCDLWSDSFLNHENVDLLADLAPSIHENVN